MPEELSRRIDASTLPTGGAVAAHYDFTHKLTKEELHSGVIRIDPYFVASIWKMPDPTGCLFHILKTIARFGKKNEPSREVDSIVKTVRRLEQLMFSK